MDIKLIALDLDGTLLNDELEITPYTCRAIQEAGDMGIGVVISTGRPFRSALRYIEQLNIEHPVICHNGAVVKKPGGEVLFNRPLEAELAREFVGFCKPRGYVLSLFYDDEIYMETPHASTWGIHERLNLVTPIMIPDFLEVLQKPPIKILVSGEPDDIDGIDEILKANYGKHLNIARSGEFYIDVVGREISKGSALTELCRMLGISMEQVLAIGDNHNDIEMIEKAGMGVVMGNAAADVKARGRFVTRSNNEDGVYYAIRKFVLDAR